MNKPVDLPESYAQEPQSGGTLISQAAPAVVAFWRVIGQHRHWVLGLFLIFVLLGYVLSKLMTPIYQATSTVLVETGKSKVVSIEQVYPGLSSERDYFRTQTQFMQSREVMLRVIRDLNLVAHPAFAGAVEKARSAASGQQQPRTPTLKDERSVSTEPGEEAVLRALSGSLEVEAVRQSQLVLLKFESPDPVLAARIANRTAEAFIQAELDMRLQMTVNASNWLSQRVAELKTRLDTSERVLADSREKANLLDRKGASGGDAGQQNADLLQKLVDARVRRAQAEGLFKQVGANAVGRENASAVSGNPGVMRARETLADAQAKFSAAESRYGSSHPVYQAAKAAVASANNAFSQQTERVIAGINKDYQVALATERALQAAVDKNRTQAQLDNRKEAEISVLEQDVLSNRQLYQTFLSRMKETATAADVQTPTARIIDAAVAPSQPVKPRSALIMASMGLLGLLAGIALAVVRSQSDTRIRSVEDVEQLLGQPVIATLPILGRAQMKQRGWLVVTEPAAYFSEMMRMGAASVHFSMLEGGAQSIAITSAIAGEGKSTVAANLALAMARTSRVLLIDGDLYRPTQHRLLGLEYTDRGLIQVLRGDIEAADAIQDLPGTRLKAMAAGKVSGDAFNIATPSHLRRLIRMLEDDFDVVIVDAPPVEVVSDGMLIAAACRRTLLITRSGATPIALVQKALRRLSRVRAKVLGIVVNGHDFQAAERFYGEKSSYKSYEEYTRGPAEAARATSSLAGASEARRAEKVDA